MSGDLDSKPLTYVTLLNPWPERLYIYTEKNRNGGWSQHVHRYTDMF